MPLDHGFLPGLDADDHAQYSLIVTGAGAPGSAPPRIGAVYVDTTNQIAYVGKGISGVADWIEAAALAMTDAQRNAVGSPMEGLETFNTSVLARELFDEVRWRALSPVGWLPRAYPLMFDPVAVYATALALAANGGAIALPVAVPGHMLLESVTVRNTDAATARTWGWALYEQYLNNGNSGENTLARVANSNGNDSFTPGAASNRTLSVASAPVYLRPGLYWLIVQSRHATSTFGLGSTAAVASFTHNTAMTKTITNPAGATLDFVAATWTKVTATYAAVLNGRVFGETAGW